MTSLVSALASFPSHVAGLISGGQTSMGFQRYREEKGREEEGRGGKERGGKKRGGEGRRGDKGVQATVAGLKANGNWESSVETGH